MPDTLPNKLFETDSGGYHILAEAVALAPADGLLLEIGLRRGGGMKFILDGIAKRGIDATVISLDCYGHMPYMHREGERDDFDYTVLCSTRHKRAACLPTTYGSPLTSRIGDPAARRREAGVM